jgi:penicillin-binding protein 2
MFFAGKELKVKRNKVEIEPQEVLLDALAQGDEKGIDFQQIETPLKNWVILGFWIFFLVLILLIFARTFQLQILSHDKFQAFAQRNKFIFSSIQSQRGVIYDRNLNQLVFNKPNFNLVCQKDKLLEEVENPNKIIEKLASILKIDPKEIQERLNKTEENEATVVYNLDYQSLIIFEGLSQEFPGFYIKNETVREYKNGPIFSHILGYHRKSGQNTGLENFYDEFLSSKPGKIIIERDAKGKIISEKVESLPQPGDSLVLWLDEALQEKLYQELKNKLKERNAKRGIAIAMDPNTGGILALVSLPSYDNNLFAQEISAEEWQKIQNDKTYPLLNRAISGRYPTGSTIKPLIAAAALQEKIITPDFKINCLGKIIVDNPWFPEKPFIFRDWKTHGITDIKKAIAESCNVFFYTIGGGYKTFKGLGPELIKKYLEFFGWGEALGIDLPGEKSGFIPDKTWKKEKFSSLSDKIWLPGDTYNLSIGQGYISITPLEVVAAFAAIANGGKLLQPQIVHKIIDEDKNTIEEFQPKVIREGFIDKENLEVVREGMRGAVVYGSATTLSDLPVKAAAKTGTAQTSKEGYYHNWLTVFAPYDHPQIVLTVMIEEVPGLHVVVAPVAREVLNWYFTRDQEE